MFGNFDFIDKEKRKHFDSLTEEGEFFFEVLFYGCAICAFIISSLISPISSPRAREHPLPKFDVFLTGCAVDCLDGKAFTVEFAFS